MQIDITGQHIEITDAIRNYVTDKLPRLEKHFDNIIGAHVILKVEKHIHTAECTLSVGGGPRLHAEDTNNDLYAAIDTMLDKLDRQVRRHKSKLTEHRK
jgi:putative sigma-54 modulation protein